jgi:hypothetical protein
VQVGAKILQAHQARIPPSLRTSGLHSTQGRSDPGALPRSPQGSDDFVRTEPPSPTGDFPIDPQSFVKAKQPFRFVSEGTDLVKLYGKRNARRIQQGKICGEDGVLYDMSLWKACFQVHKQDAVISIMLLVLGSTCFPLKAERHSTEHVDSIEMALPLMSRVIIDRVSAARSGGGTGRAPASTISLAIGFFVLMNISNICIVHSKRISSILGPQTRGAVSALRPSTGQPQLPSIADDIAHRYDQRQGHVSPKTRYVRSKTDSAGDSQPKPGRITLTVESTHMSRQIPLVQ